VLLAAGAEPLFVCRQTGTSLEMIEKRYGDARVDARRLDQMIGDVDGSTRNPPGTPEIERDDSLPSKAKEPVVFYGLPTRAGDRGRTGDVQLGNLIESSSRTRAEPGIARFSSVRCAPGCPRVPRCTATKTATRIELLHRVVKMLRSQVRVTQRHRQPLAPSTHASCSCPHGYMKSDCGVAADLASHFYEDIRDDRPSSIVDHLPSMYRVFDRIRELADAVELIVLGHVP
jgi:hypothetical protein